MRRTRSRFVLEVDGAGVEAVAQVGGAAQVDGSAQVGGNLVTTGAARRSPRKLGGHHGGVKPPVSAAIGNA